jgi:hypothetical protein
MPLQTTADVHASLGLTASSMPSHAQVLTITPLDNDATIIPMTPQQIAAYQAPTTPVLDAVTPPGQSLTVTPPAMRPFD